MSRPLRVNRAGSWHHVMARGINRRRIFRDDTDRLHWLDLLAEMSERFHIHVHAYVLMKNHYHIILEIQEANLSRAMQWMQVSYSMWHNVRHGRVGPLFQGRFRNVVIENGRWAYELSVYLHLNPLQIEEFRLSRRERKATRKGIGPKPSAEECRRRLEKLRQYRWSSYFIYAGYEQQPAWLATKTLWSRSGGKDEYRNLVEKRLCEGVKEEMIAQLRDRFAFGTERFKQRIYVAGRESGRETAGRKAFKSCVSFENMLASAEKITGEQLDIKFKRCNTTVKLLTMWGGRRLCGLTLNEIGERLGGMDYNAVNMALRRWENKLKQNPKIAETTKKLKAMCNV